MKKILDEKLVYEILSAVGEIQKAKLPLTGRSQRSSAERKMHGLLGVCLKGLHSTVIFRAIVL